LSLTKPTEPIAAGAGLTLTGSARGVAGPITLEGKEAGGSWLPVTTLATDTSGAFSVVVRPSVTTQYRLAVGNVRAAVVKVVVTTA
jgi:hypothetical protein